MSITNKLLKPQLVCLVFLHVTFLLVTLINFPVGKWFMGWDSIHPELNFSLNMIRGLFAAWQENYGAGTLTGHGFAATLPHTLITWLMSLVISTQSIRPAFALLCFYLGGLGMYFLISHLLRKAPLESPFGKIIHLPWVVELTSLAASCFYLFNLATIQNFYLELEAFIVHFATLPWLFFAVILLMEKITRKRLLFFLAINIFASIQGFIPPLFAVYFLSLCLFLLAYFFNTKNRTALLKVFLIVALTIATNAYWIGPFSYYVLSHGANTGEAYNNIMQTPEFSEKSQKYGDLHNVALLKGFYWDTFELGENVFTPWQNHYTGLIEFFGYLFFTITVAGLIGSLFLNRNWYSKGFSLVFLFFFANLATNVFPFSLIISLLYKLSSLYYQVFRTTFTKFSLGLGFIYSVFFAYGIITILFLAQKYLKKQHIRLVPLVFVLLLIIYGFPVFKEELFYKKLLLNLPQAYFDVMSYFKTQPDGRIADFPQDCAEGWYSYRWGYFGSGFYWYGIKQPIMSRVFDIWSTANENYYWELTQALRTKNYSQVDQVLDKYDVKWLLYDPNFIHCRNQESFLTTASYIEYVKNNPGFYKVASFTSNGILPITIYERNETAGFVRTTNFTQSQATTDMNDKDYIFRDSGVYINSTNPQLVYPFMGLFTKRGSNNLYTIKTTDSAVSIETKLAPYGINTKLTLPNFSESEDFLPISLSLKPTNNKYSVFITYDYPEIYLDGVKLTPPQIEEKLGEIAIEDPEVYVNRELIGQINKIYISALTLKNQNEILITNSRKQTLLSWKDSLVFLDLVKKTQSIALPFYSQGDLKIVFPKLQGSLFGGSQIVNQNILPRPCGETSSNLRNKFEITTGEPTYTRLISSDSSECQDFVFAQASTSLAYLLEINHRHIEGNRLEASITNKNRPVGIDVLLKNQVALDKEMLVLPPTFPSEEGYVVSFINNSFSTKSTINDIQAVSLTYFPYTFLTSIKFSSSEPVVKHDQEPVAELVHPADIYYKASIKLDSSLLYLSQSYDPGWLAFVKTSHFPYYLPLNKHVLVNNWANGWNISSSNIWSNGNGQTTVYLFFWPQLLEWLGFVLLPITLICIWFKNEHSRRP